MNAINFLLVRSPLLVFTLCAPEYLSPRVARQLDSSSTAYPVLISDEFHLFGELLKLGRGLTLGLTPEHQVLFQE
jgi:hypothetical protein